MALLRVSHHGLVGRRCHPCPHAVQRPYRCGLGRPMRRRAKVLPYRPYRCHTWNTPQHRRP
eukprot:7079618-Prymnesium_polylepis.1